MKRYLLILFAFLVFTLNGQEYNARPIFSNGSVIFQGGSIHLNTLDIGKELQLIASSISEDSLTYNPSSDLVTYANADTVVLDGSSEVIIGNSVRFGTPTTGSIYQVVDTLGSSDTLILDQNFIGSVTDEYYWGGVDTWYDESGNGNHLYQSNPLEQPKLLGHNTNRPRLYFDGTNDVLQAIDGTILDISEQDFSFNYKMEFLQPTKPATEYFITKGGGAAIGYAFYKKNNGQIRILMRDSEGDNLDHFLHSDNTGTHTNSNLFNYLDTISTYVDDIYVGSDTINQINDISNLAYKFTIGAFGSTVSEILHANMELEYIQIYNRILTQSEIVSLNDISNTVASKRNYIEDSIFYISDKYSDSQDLVIEFDSCMYNNLVSFKQIGLNDNIGISPMYSIENTPDEILINIDSDGDVIGPYNLKDYGFISANHGYLGDLVNVSSAYTPGDGLINLADASGFIQSGGIGRTGSTNFNYTGVSGNQITGVDLGISLTTSDQVRIYPLTAYTDNYSYYIDNVLRNSGRYWGNSNSIIVNNTVYDPSTLSVIDGSMDELLKEDVIYNYSEGNINVDLTFELQKNQTFNIYYGMQWPILDSVYYPAGQNTDIRLAINGLNSGQSQTYNVDRAIMKSADYNIALWVDNTVGIGSSRLIDATDPIFFNTQFKLYNQFIATESNLLLGEIYEWEGVFTIFENLSDVFSFSYIMKYNDSNYLYVDWHSQATDTISIDYNSISIEESVGSANIIQLDSENLIIQTTSDYGYLKANIL